MRALEPRYLDGVAKRRLCESELQPAVEVLAASLETRILLNVEHYIEIAWSSAGYAVVALSRYVDGRAVVESRRDVDLDLGGLLNKAATFAVVAWIVDQ